jgi:hypothetical protein
MACPNLERFTGFYLPFDHEYDRLTHALSTRPYLKEKTWTLRGIEEGWDSKGVYVTNARPIRGDSSIDNGDVFLHYHANWRHLDTLMLFGQDTGNLDYRAFVGTFRALPSLKHLLLSRFNKSQFNDRTLAALPLGLHSLRLQDLRGITEKGLYRLLDSSTVHSLRSLALVNMDLKSAWYLSRFFKTTPHLTRFSLAQSVSPNLDTGHFLQEPYYASTTLRFLHWDISPFAQPSISNIAASISAGAFPALRLLRAPCDDGTLQALCRPVALIARPHDADMPASALSLHSNLATARLAAQERLEAKRAEPLLAVVVTDEDGVITNNYIIRNYMGDIASRIRYHLVGDFEVEGMDHSGILELEHLVGPTRRSTESLGSRKSYRQGHSACAGASETGWAGNKGGGFQVKSGKWHPARERIRIVEAPMFF